MPTERLNGRLALVTGAGRGNGRAIALGLSSAGARVVVTDIDPDTAADTAALIHEQGGKAWSHRLDVSDAAEAMAVGKRVASDIGHVGILVNNAGVMIRVRVGSESAAEVWRRTFSVNVDGPYNVVEALLGQLRQEKGSIVNITSIHATMTSPHMVAYAASKGALLQLTRGLAAELARDGIRVNAVAPGIMDTAMTTAVKDNPALLVAALSHVPMRRMGQPDELCAAVNFLVDEASSYVTGAVLAVDGGFLTI